VIGLYIVSGVGDAANAVWLGSVLEPLLESLFEGPYGLDALLTARTTFLNIEATLSTGDRVVVWRALPDVGQWATATLLWTGAGLVTPVGGRLPAPRGPAGLSAPIPPTTSRFRGCKWRSRFGTSQRRTPTGFMP
jgi:hypothetical protein